MTEPASSAQAKPEQWFPNPTQFGGPRVFRVIDGHSDQDYVQVSLPSMPNGQLGWVERSEVELSTIEHQALIDLSTHSVTVWHGDSVISETSAVPGAPATPTPLGVFYVRDIIEQPDPAGAYGSHILALSGFSETLSTFNGGLPAIAIHGTNNPSSIGTAQSSGCIRLLNEEVVDLYRRTRIGTKVVVI